MFRTACEDDPELWSLVPLEAQRRMLLWPLASLYGEAPSPDAWLRRLDAWADARDGRVVAALTCCGGPAPAGALLEWPARAADCRRALRLVRCWLVEPARPGVVARALLAALRRRALGLGADGVLVARDAGLGAGTLRGEGYTDGAEHWFLPLPRAGGSPCAGRPPSS